MSERSYIPMGFLAVILVALFGRGAASSRSPEEGASDSAAVAESAFAGAGTRLLQDFYGAASVDGIDCRSRVCDFDVIIGILPDPFASAIDWGFDSNLEAMRRGFETAGYVGDRWSLPWSRDSAVQASSTPGALLFRAGNDSNITRLRLLLIVGEQPTSGVYPVALEAALNERAALIDALSRRHWQIAGQDLHGEDPDVRDAVRIIGPTFSGSIPALGRVLERWTHASLSYPLISIVSGSATGVSNVAHMTDVDRTLRARRHVDARCDDCGPVVQYRATVSNDDVLMTGLMQVLQDGYGYEPEEIALLRESGTAYSSALRTGTAVTDSTGPDTAAAAHASAGSDHPEESGEGGILDIVFPMNISGLRAMSATQSQPGGVERPIFAEPPLVSLTLGDQQRRRDQPYTMSQLTPATQELALEEIAATLNLRGIRAVGIIATDVRDKLFLGQMLRRRLNGVQFFTTESNALLLRSPLGVAMRGMLVATTYPLVLPGAWWTRDRTSRIAFASEAAAGIFNATVLQLFADPTRAPLTGGVTADRLGELHLPVWITVVGDRSFLPLRVRTPPAIGLTDDTLPPEQASFVSIFGLGLTLLALLALGWLMHRRWRAPDVRPERVHTDDTVLHQHETLYQLVAVSAVGGGFLPALIILRGHHIYEHLGDIVALRGHPVDTFALVAVLAWIALLGVSLHAFVRAFRRGTSRAPHPHPGLSSWPLSGPIFLLFTVLYLAGTLWYSVSALQPHDHEYAVLLRYRALQLGSEFSPILPLLLFAVFCLAWSLWHMRRVRMLATFSPVEEIAMRAAVPAGGVPLARVQRVRMIQRYTFPNDHKVRLGILTLGICALVLALFARYTGSAEMITGDLHAAHLLPHWLHSPFDVLLFLGLATSYIVLIWNLHRLYLVWKELHCALAEIATSSIQPALERVMKRVRRQVRPGVINDETRIAFEVEERRLWKVLRAPERASLVLPLAVPVTQASAEREAGDAVIDVRRGAARRRQDAQSGTETIALLAPPTVAPADPVEGCRESRERIRAAPDDPDDADVLETLHACLARAWRDRPEGAGDADAPADTPDGWTARAADLFALKIADYAMRARRYVIEMAGLLLLTMLVLNGLLASYWFVSRPEFRLVFIVLLVLSVGGILIVLTEMNRDVVLSTVAGTDPGVLNWNPRFVMNLVLFVVLPVLAAISSDVPTVRNILFSWLEPAMRTTMGMGM